MEKTKNFLLTVYHCLNPFHLERLSERVQRHAITYFFSVIFLGFILMSLIFLPKIGFFSYNLEQKIGQFDDLFVSVNYTTPEPIQITKNRPLLIIDSSGSVNATKAKMLLSKGDLYAGLFFRTHKFELGNFKDVKYSANEISKAAATILFLMLPMIAVILYLFFVIKYGIIIFFLCSLAYYIAKTVRFDITSREVFTIGAYASTIFILLDMIRFGLGYPFYGIQYIIFIIYMVVGMLNTGVSERNKGKFTGKVKHKVFE